MEGRPLLTPELLGALAKAVPSRAVLVWFYLWSRADRTTAEAWPAARTIARDLPVNRNHVLEHIRRLETAGWLTVERGAGTRSKYRLCIPQTVVSTSGPVETGGVSSSGPEVVSTSGPHRYLLRDQHPNTTRNPTKNPTKARRTKRTNEDEEVAKLPLPFESDRFRQAWSDFEEHRKQIKAPLTILGATRLLAKCQRFGERMAVEAIDASIENNWKGIFPPRGGNGQPEEYKPVRVFK